MFVPFIIIVITLSGGYYFSNERRKRPRRNFEEVRRRLNNDAAWAAIGPGALHFDDENRRLGMSDLNTAEIVPYDAVVGWKARD